MPSNFKAQLVDGRGHLLGRLASVIAKQLLNGGRVTVVRCEDLNISGSLFRNKLKFEAFLNKRTATNPKKGPIHYRAPSKILWRTVRGMLPHKTARGTAALGRLRVFEGIPAPFDTQKRMVVPDAIRNLRLKPGRKFCRVGDLATVCGWKHNDLIATLEAKRKVKSAAFGATKKALVAVKAKATASVAKELEPINEKLAVYGY